jgi:hypothetical protein
LLAPNTDAMASYNTGRVNVSQYLRNLNVQEPAVEETFITDEDLEKDLALFTNTQFYDFETGRQTDYQAPPVKPEVIRSPTEEVTPTESLIGDFSTPYDFPLPGGFLGIFVHLYRLMFCFCPSRLPILAPALKNLVIPHFSRNYSSLLLWKETSLGGLRGPL